MKRLIRAVAIAAFATAGLIGGMASAAHAANPLPPNAPTNVKATAGSSVVSISWNAPGDNGSPISSYTVIASPGGTGVIVPGGYTSTAVGDLTNGTSYTFTVTATNAGGAGAPSLPSNAVTPKAGTLPNVYVATPANGGSDTHSCAQASPCATLALALRVVAADGIIHVGAGTFVLGDGRGCYPRVRSGCTPTPLIEQRVSIVGEGVAITDLEGGATLGVVAGDTPDSVAFSDLTVQHGEFFVDYSALSSFTRTKVAHGDGFTVNGGLSISYSVIDDDGEVVNNFGGTTVSHSTVENGDGLVGYAGLRVSDSIVRNNSVGIFVSEFVFIERTQIVDNGVGLQYGSYCCTEITNSTIARNGIGIDGTIANISDSSIVDNGGDGIRNRTYLTLTRSTVSGNGGSGVVDIAETRPQTEISDSTIANNAGDGVQTGFDATIVRSTIAGNGGIGLNNSSASDPTRQSVGGSIVSRNAGGNCLAGPNGTMTDDGYNLEDDPAHRCGFSTANHDFVGIDPQLGPLQNNGGPTKTMLPGAPSPVINAIPNPTSGLCPGSDQRGISRPQGPRCDIGAVEVANTRPVVTTNPTSTTVDAGQQVTFTAAGSGVPAPKVQWKVSSDGGATFGAIPGATSPSLVFTASSSQNGRQYRALFTNAVGTAATAVATLTVRSVPGAPTRVSAVPGNGVATVSWTAPASSGNLPILGYRVTPYRGGVAQSAQNVNSAATTHLVGGLTNGVSYTFKVSARNALGQGPDSAASPSVIAGSPAAPTGVSAAKSASGHLRVSFTPGASNGAAVTSYTATCTSSNGGITKTQTGASGPITVTGLTTGKSYRCTVAATNARGTGPGSPPSPPVTA